MNRLGRIAAAATALVAAAAFFSVGAGRPAVVLWRGPTGMAPTGSVGGGGRAVPPPAISNFFSSASDTGLGLANA